ncbi:MAG: DNA polymerase IV [Oscillospiraceae bacterium]
MDRMILHSDINACYASIELLRHPELRGRPVAVGGERELRHGIILAKDQMARAAGVRTGMTLWAARQQCPELTILPPDFDLYYDYSRRVREVYAGFTDRCEPFGMDECWLDMTGCVGHEDALRTAQEVRQRVLDATGLTVSVGVSWCKAIAKLGSDYRKPNAVTVIDRARFADMVWPLPVSSLLFAGRSSVRQLERLGIRTVGALAAADADVLEQRLGKGGRLLHAYANGYDPRRCTASRICRRRNPSASATAPRDLICEADARAALLSLAESVARACGWRYQCRTVELSVRTADLHWCSHRMALRHPSDLTSELLDAALALCEQAHLWPDPLRSIGIRALELVPACAPHQLDLFEDAEHRARQRQLDITLDNLRARYGKTCVLRGRACFDPALGLVQREEHAFLRK